MTDPVEPPPTLGQRIHRGLWGGPGGPLGPDGPQRAIIAVAAAIVVTAVAVAVLAARGHGGHSVVLTQGTSTTTSAGVTPGAPGVTVTALPPDTTAVTAAPTTTTTATTVVNPTTTAPTTTTTTVAPLADCASGNLQARASSDRNRYASGETVTISVTVTNVSANPCLVQNPFPSPFVIPISIRRGSMVVWQPGSTTNGIAAPQAPKVLGPNESYGWTSVQWNQRMCVAPACSDKGPDGPLVPPGTYTATPQDAPGTAMAADFKIQ